MNQTKVLLLTNTILHYRLELYNQLAEKIDFTVATVNNSKYYENEKFKHKKLKSKKIGPFYFQRGISKLCREYNVVIAMFDIAYLNFMRLPFVKRRFKVIFWGIGVATERGYDVSSSVIKDKIRYFLVQKADAAFFYSEYPVKKYIENGVDKDKLFVARNTIFNDYKFITQSNRDSFLFVGSLTARKKIYILLEAFKRALDNIPPNIILNIIGDGAEYENIASWISKNKLESRIILKGKIIGKELKKYFERAFACISPGQAGLSVLESLSYGVPFVTMQDAITGGEKFNIQHGYNGFFINGVDDLKIVIERLSILGGESDYYRNAYDTYQNGNRMSDMRDAIVKVVTRVHNKI